VALAIEVSMGNPTAGQLVTESGLQLKMCSPAFIWSDDSRYLAVPQFFKHLGFLRRQRLLVVDFRDRNVYQSKEIAYYFQPETFNNGVLKVTKEPFKTKQNIEYRVPSELDSFTAIRTAWD